MKYWIEYGKGHKKSFLLYLATVTLFLVTAGLSHVEDFKKLLYATLLTFALWLVVALISGLRYVEQCRKLDEAIRIIEKYQDTELLEIMKRKEFQTFRESTAADGVKNRLNQMLLLVGEAQKQVRMEREKKEADRRDYFLMWTHQIKTPISALRLLLANQQGGKDAFLMKEELFKVEQYADMVLTFQRMDNMSSDMDLQEYDLLAFIRQTVRKYSVLFINKGLSVVIPKSGALVLTDKKWLTFCLEQLLSNSIKYTEKGEIKFRIEEENNLVRLTLEDTGIGIRKEDLPRIFEQGFTGYNGRLDKKSTGIGLYLCKQVFEKLGIPVEVKSQVGLGTKVIMTIPKREDANLTKV